MGRTKNLYRTLLNTLLPASCIHCDTSIEKGWFCPTCQATLQLLDPKEHCSRCFTYCPGSCGCSLFWQQGALFLDNSLSRSLLSHARHFHGLRQLLTSLTILQHDRLGWPLPTLLTTPPLSPFSWLHRHAPLTQRWSQALSQRWCIPRKSLLTKKGERIFANHTINLQGETILVLDQILSKKRCEEYTRALNQRGAVAVYVLALSWSL